MAGGELIEKDAVRVYFLGRPSLHREVFLSLLRRFHQVMTAAYLGVHCCALGPVLPAQRTAVLRVVLMSRRLSLESQPGLTNDNQMDLFFVFSVF